LEKYASSDAQIFSYTVSFLLPGSVVAAHPCEHEKKPDVNINIESRIVFFMEIISIFLDSFIWLVIFNVMMVSGD
jgi:hypothetical protein